MDASLSASGAAVATRCERVYPACSPTKLWSNKSSSRSGILTAWSRKQIPPFAVAPSFATRPIAR